MPKNMHILAASLAMLLLAAAPAPGGEKPSYEKAADDMIARFAKNDFSDAAFTKTMKEAGVSNIAETLWADFTKQFGDFVGAKILKTETVLEFKRVHEECSFERGTVVFMVVVDPADLVAGLFVLSAEKTETEKDGAKPDAARPPIWFLQQEAQDRPPHLEVWNGNTNMMTMMLTMRVGDGKWLELTDEQRQKLAYLAKPQEIGVEWFQKMQREQNAEYLAADQAAAALIPPDDPRLERATDEQKRAYVEAFSKPMLLFYRHVQNDVNETLSPEQLRKLRSLEFSRLPDLGEATPHMFDSLGLSEEQRKKVEAIKREFEPEFLKLLDERMDLRKEHLVLYTQGKNSDEDRKDYRARFLDRQNRRVEFAKRLRDRLRSDVLTEEQRARALAASSN